MHNFSRSSVPAFYHFAHPLNRFITFFVSSFRMIISSFCSFAIFFLSCFSSLIRSRIFVHPFSVFRVASFFRFEAIQMAFSWRFDSFLTSWCFDATLKYSGSGFSTTFFFLVLPLLPRFHSAILPSSLFGALGSRPDTLLLNLSLAMSLKYRKREYVIINNQHQVLDLTSGNTLMSGLVKSVGWVFYVEAENNQTRQKGQFWSRKYSEESQKNKLELVHKAPGDIRGEIGLETVVDDFNRFIIDPYYASYLAKIVYHQEMYPGRTDA